MRRPEICPAEDIAIEAYLDQLRLTDLPTGTTTVGRIVTDLRDRLAGTGRLLVGIRADGVDVASDALEAVLSTTTEGYGRLEFISVEPRELVGDVLRQARASFGGTLTVREEIADLLSAGQMGPAMERLSECFGAWSGAHEAVVKSAALLEIDLGTLRVGEQTALATMEAVAGQLRGLRDALAAGDTVLTADLLRYEFGETLTRWAQVIDVLLARAG